MKPIVMFRGLVVLLMSAMCGCMIDPREPETGAEPLPPSLRNESIDVHNDPGFLESRLVREERVLGIRASGSDATTAGKSVASGVRLTLVGQVPAPEVSGLVVQANDIHISGKKAVVAYNYAGDPFLGAIQVIDFHKPGAPEIVSEILFRRMDVNAVLLQGNHVYAGLASADEVLSSPALVGEFKLTSGGLEVTGDWLDLQSWAVTDLAERGQYLVASVGAREGGIALMKRSRLELVAFTEEPDVRGVDYPDARSLLSVCGGQGLMARHRMPELEIESRVPVPGYVHANAKGTIEVHKDRCYLGAGDGGFQVRDSEGGLLDQVENGAMSSAGLAVTNAVSIEKHLAFVAAGAGGVQVVDLGRYTAGSGRRDSVDGLRVLGQIDFEEGVSSNMVKAKNDILVVAAGVGGVKLIEMEYVEETKAEAGQ